MVDRTDLGIAVVAYRSRELVVRCVESVQRELRGASWCLAVVNNSPGDGTTRALEAECGEGIVAVDAPRNLGFAAGCNLAAEKLPKRCRYLLLLNPDTELKDASAAELVRYLDDHPEVGIAGAQLCFEDGRPQPSARRFPSLGNLIFSRRSPLSRLLPGNSGSRDYVYADRDIDLAGPVDAVAGAALAIRSSLWRELGGMDESFFMYGEDSDLCYRAREKGWEVHLVPAAKIHHRWGGATTKHRIAASVEHQRSIVRFLRKHGKVSRPTHLLLGGIVAIEGFFFKLPRR